MNGALSEAMKRSLTRYGKAEIEQPTITGDLLMDLLDNWANIQKDKLYNSLLNSQLPGNPTSGRASKDLLQSLAPLPAVTRGDEAVVKIQAAEHYQWVDGGREPTAKTGNGQLVSNLKLWISDKGIRPEAKEGQEGKTIAELNTLFAEAIARKIHANGYLGNKFFSKVINDQTFDELGEYLATAMGEKIALSITMLAKPSKEYKPPF